MLAPRRATSGGRSTLFSRSHCAIGASVFPTPPFRAYLRRKALAAAMSALTTRTASVIARSAAGGSTIFTPAFVTVFGTDSLCGEA